MPLPPVRRDEGLAPQGLAADRGGRLELNRNPENYLAEAEQAAFNPAHGEGAAKALGLVASEVSK